MVILGLASPFTARVNANPLIVFERDVQDLMQPESSTGVTERDRFFEGPRDLVADNPKPDGRDVPKSVPEPATVILTGIGLASLVARRARRTLATRS